MLKKNNSSTEEQPVANNSFVSNILLGGILGAAEVLFNHPLCRIKNKIQRKQKLSLNPKVIYKGLGLNLMCMMPATAVQVSMAGAIENRMKNKSISMIPAFFGGGFSAIISTPAELIMMHTGNPYLKQIVDSSIKEQNIAWFYKGAFGTTVRDGVFTVGFLSAPDIIEKKIHQHFGEHAICAEKFSGPIAGIFAALLSHPFDTVKNVQQASVMHNNLSFIEATKELINKHGMLSLYKGSLDRSIRVVSAVTIMSEVDKRLQSRLGIQP